MALGEDFRYRDLIKARKPRRVRTPGGAKKYGQPIGTIITRDMLARAARAAERAGQAAGNAGGGPQGQAEAPKRPAPARVAGRKAVRPPRGPVMNLARRIAGAKDQDELINIVMEIDGHESLDPDDVDSLLEQAEKRHAWMEQNAVKKPALPKDAPRKAAPPRQAPKAEAPQAPEKPDRGTTLSPDVPKQAAPKAEAKRPDGARTKAAQRLDLYLKAWVEKINAVKDEDELGRIVQDIADDEELSEDDVDDLFEVAGRKELILQGRRARPHPGKFKYSALAKIYQREIFGAQSENALWAALDDVEKDKRLTNSERAELRRDAAEAVDAMRKQVSLDARAQERMDGWMEFIRDANDIDELRDVVLGMRDDRLMQGEWGKALQMAANAKAAKLEGSPIKTGDRVMRVSNPDVVGDVVRARGGKVKVWAGDSDPAEEWKKPNTQDERRADKALADFKKDVAGANRLSTLAVLLDNRLNAAFGGLALRRNEAISAWNAKRKELKAKERSKPKTPAKGQGPNVMAVEVDPAFFDDEAIDALLDKAQDDIGRKLLDPKRGDIIMIRNNHAGARNFIERARKRGLDVRELSPVGVGQRRKVADQDLAEVRRVGAQANGRIWAAALRPADHTVVGRWGLPERFLMNPSRKRGENPIIVQPGFRGDDEDPAFFGLESQDLREVGIVPARTAVEAKERLRQKIRLPRELRPDPKIGLSGKPGWRAEDTAEQSEEAYEAQVAHFSTKDGGIGDAPGLGLWNFLRSHPERFAIEPNGEAGISANFWVKDNGKKPPERWMLKQSAAGEDIMFDVSANWILASAGFITPPTGFATSLGAGGRRWLRQRDLSEHEDDLDMGGGKPKITNYSIDKMRDNMDKYNGGFEPRWVNKIQNGPDPDSTVRMIVFDYLINNLGDRHARNFLLMNHGERGMSVGIIDQGFAFENAAAVGYPAKFDFGVEDFVNNYRGRGRGSWNNFVVASQVANHHSAKLREQVAEAIAGFRKVDGDEIVNRLARDGATESQIRLMQRWMEEFYRRLDHLEKDFDILIGAILNDGAEMKAKGL